MNRTNHHDFNSTETLARVGGGLVVGRWCLAVCAACPAPPLVRLLPVRAVARVMRAMPAMRTIQRLKEPIQACADLNKPRIDIDFSRLAAPQRHRVMDMPFVRRDAQGALVSLHRHADDASAEWLAHDDAQVIAFLGQSPAAGFDQLDADFIRVLEDLIDALIRQRVININDLPPAAQRKLYSRKDHRAPKALTELNLLGDAPSAEGSALTDFAPFS